MKMSSLYSYGMATKNEEGNTEVFFTRTKTFWQLVLKTNVKEQAFYKVGDLWVDKNNDRYASEEEVDLCNKILSLF